MDKTNLDKKDLQELINFALTENNIDINSIDPNRIEVIIADYFDYCKDFKTKYVFGELDTFKKAACLLVAINRSRLIVDKRVNASVAIDAAQKMCEKPYWNVGPKANIPQKMEEIDIKTLFQKDMYTYEKHKTMLTDALVYENGVEPISCYLNLELFYRVAIELKKQQLKDDIDRISDFNITPDNSLQEDVCTNQMLIPSGGTTNWMINCRDRGYRACGYHQNIVKEITISNDCRIVIADHTQPNHNNSSEEEFFTSIIFYKKELDNHSIYAPNTYERGYVVYYPYGVRFDEKLLKQLGTALSNLMNKARDLNDNVLNRKRLKIIYLHQKKLVELLINGTNDKNAVNKIMYDMAFMSTADHIREARFKKDWLPYFTDELFDDVKELQSDKEQTSGIAKTLKK